MEDALLAHERRTPVFLAIEMLLARMRDYVTCATRSASAKHPPAEVLG